MALPWAREFRGTAWAIPAVLEVTTPKREMAIVVEEGKMQKIWVNDILHFNGVNAEEFLALPGSQN